MAITTIKDGQLFTNPITKQDLLVSGTNIKTVNSTSLLGSGNISLTNIYNTSSPITGNRIVTLGNFTLSFPSNIVNGFSVDGTTFSVDALNNRVGIGTIAPATKLDVVGLIRTQGYTVATLPTWVIGAIAYVTDGLSPTYRAIAVGGGTEVVSVFFNGTNWIFN